MANPRRKKIEDVKLEVEPFWYEIPNLGRKKLIKTGVGIRGYGSGLNPLEEGELEIPPGTEVEMVEV